MLSLVDDARIRSYSSSISNLNWSSGFEAVFRAFDRVLEVVEVPVDLFHLDFVIRRVRKLGLDIVDLDEAIRRIESNEPSKQFVVFTFDDAYRDNLRFALPVLRRQQCPFTLYVPTALVDGVGEVWWQGLEDIVATQNALAVTGADGETTYLPSATVEEKHAAYDTLYRRMRTMPELERVALIRDLAKQYGFDLDRQCRELIMDWTELRSFAAEQLCTIGAHTVHHYELAKLSVAEARVEIDQSVKIIKAQATAEPTFQRAQVGMRKKFQLQTAAFEDHPVLVPPTQLEPQLRIESQRNLEVTRWQVRCGLVHHATIG
ncbi:MAG: hypothetical protein EOP83_36570, partial [Verrucomicrobiaceae bacterium]